MLTQFAAATAVIGTKRPTNGFSFYESTIQIYFEKLQNVHKTLITRVKRFSDNAVIRAQLVANTYEVIICLQQQKNRNILIEN